MYRGHEGFDPEEQSFYNAKISELCQEEIMAHQVNQLTMVTILGVFQSFTRPAFFYEAIMEAHFSCESGPRKPFKYIFCYLRDLQSQSPTLLRSDDRSHFERRIQLIQGS